MKLRRLQKTKDNSLLIKPPDGNSEEATEDQKFRLHCNERLDGLLKHFYLKAA